MHIVLRASAPVALIAVRLCDVAADGSSARVTFGLLNLTHRDGHGAPKPLNPGEAVNVRVPLNAIAHRFAAGSVIRLALSSAYWPMVWPSPEPATLTIQTEGTWLTLPARPPGPADATLTPFGPPQTASPTSAQIPLQPPHLTRTIERDLVNHQVLYRMVSEGGDLESGAVARIDAIDLDLGHSVERLFAITDNDPLAARAEMSERLMLRRGDWEVSVQADTEMTANAREFRIRAKLRALLGDEEILCRDWDERIPRDLL